MSSERPWNGLTIQEAFKRWADPQDVAGMQEFSDARSYGLTIIGGPRTMRDIRQDQYENFEKNCTDALMVHLRSGKLLASGISHVEEEEDRRKVIHPSMWAVLEIHNFWDRISGSNRTYHKPEFFEATAIPLNVGKPPAWILEFLEAAVPSEIRFEADYTRVVLGGEVIPCGPKQSRILCELLEAAKRGSPWCEGKKLLELGGSASSNMGELFKHDKWDKIIESDRRGRYRLALPAK